MYPAKIICHHFICCVYNRNKIFYCFTVYKAVLKLFFILYKFELELLNCRCGCADIFVGRKSMYLQTFGNYCKVRKKSLGPQIANTHIKNQKSQNKFWSANRKSAKCHICGRAAKLAKFLKSSNFRICDSRNLFADRPPL